jgi:hypothetical protein
MISATNVRSVGDPVFPKPDRSWQEISEEASHTTDPKRLQELALELVRAFDARDKIEPRSASPPEDRQQSA